MAEVHYAQSQPGKNITYVKSLKGGQTNACFTAKVLVQEGPHQVHLWGQDSTSSSSLSSLLFSSSGMIQVEEKDKILVASKTLKREKSDPQMPWGKLSLK